MHPPRPPDRRLIAAGAALLAVTGLTVVGCANPPDDDDRPGHVDTSQDVNPCADLDDAPDNCEALL